MGKYEAVTIFVQVYSNKWVAMESVKCTMFNVYGVTLNKWARSDSTSMFWSLHLSLAHCISFISYCASNSNRLKKKLF